MPVATLKKINTTSDSLNLPEVLRTPTGLVLIEIQGTVHIGRRALASAGSLGLENEENKSSLSHDLIGKFDFSDLENGGKEIILNVDQHQRLRGKVVKLKDPIAIIRTDVSSSQLDSNVSVIPIVEIVEFKAVFSNMPEPIVYKS